MAVRVFLSSVQSEFTAERAVLRDRIERLGDACICMERYGAASTGPAPYDAAAVAGCDLLVCIAGDEYGSVDPNTSTSYTELEFGTALERGIPCLAYLKQSTTATPDSRQVAFRARLRGHERLINQFTTAEQLGTQFLIDFVHELRTSLIEKFGLQPLGPLSTATIQALTAAVLDEHITAVGGDRYDRGLYVSRKAEDEFDRFVGYGRELRHEGYRLIEVLREANAAWPIGESAAQTLNTFGKSLDAEQSGDSFSRQLEAVRRAFDYENVAEAVRWLDAAIAAPQSGRLPHAEMSKAFSRGALAARGGAPVANALLEARARGRTGVRATVRALPDLTRLFPSAFDRVTRSERLANDVIDDLAAMVERSRLHCLAVVSRAGTGKTNLMCDAARRFSAEWPVVILPGSLLTAVDASIEEQLEHYLEGSFGQNLSSWVSRSRSSLTRDGRHILVFLDAINETPDPAELLPRLRHFVDRTRDSRVKIIVSCRDVLWEQFANAVESSLFLPPIKLEQFTETEWLTALARYLDRYRITADITEAAARSLRRPVLLRFFCLVYRGHALGVVHTVQLSGVFAKYLERLRQAAHEQLGTAHAQNALDLLLGIARQMWERQDRQGSLDSLGDIIADAQLRAAALLFLKSEGVLEEAAGAPLQRARAVRFAHDELMEFTIARAWIDGGAADSLDRTDGLIELAVGSIAAFPAAGGALLYFDELLNRKGELINRAFTLARAAIELLTVSHQVQLLYFFEAVPVEHLGDAGLGLLDRFEELAADQIRDRIGPLVVSALRAHPDSRHVRAITARVLEVGSPAAPKPPARREARRKEKLRKVNRAEKSMPLPKHALPPARHHYSEETRLAAIGLLIGIGDDSATGLARHGIRKVGDKLHAALGAVRALDGATDDIVCRSIEHFIQDSVPEYRILSAWLLRERYGAVPARLLVSLLTDPERRVYEYTARLLASRRIEPELVTAILGRLTNAGDPNWHRVHLIRVLSRREQLVTAGMPRPQAIVDLVRGFCKSGDAHVRIEAYRCLFAYPEFAPIDDLLQAVRRDADRYVRALAIWHENKQADGINGRLSP